MTQPTPEQKAAEAQYAEMMDTLLPEAQYHFNAMKALSGVANENFTFEERSMVVNISIAWSLLGILRAKVREGST